MDARLAVCDAVRPSAISRASRLSASRFDEWRSPAVVVLDCEQTLTDPDPIEKPTGRRVSSDFIRDLQSDVF